MYELRTYRLQFFVLLITLTMFGCKETQEEKIIEPSLTEEQLYRPNFHFTPKANWMNDPNGMFYLNGVYHLFFQYYPQDNVWGPMHWGHATSNDMISWEEQEIALYPDDLGYIFSGSAVVDHNNTSGFGDGENVPVVAIFTYHDPKGEKEERIDFQTQGIAYSLDEGKSWTKYEGNPVIPNPGIKDFRDPKVIWDDQHNQWIMVLATYSETLFYSSANLKEWELISSFGKNLGAHGGVWECPDFFPIEIEGTNKTKWVLLQSLNPGSYNGGSGTQYFIGDFDGTSFKLDGAFTNQLKTSKAVWLDYGRDNYAGVTWSNIPKEDGRKLFIGWMSNWDYAQEVPTTIWRSTMTVARELKLFRKNGFYNLRSFPVAELAKNEKPIVKKELKSAATSEALFSDPTGLNKHHIVINFNKNAEALKFSIGNQNEQLYFGIKDENTTLFLDRSQLNLGGFSEKFAANISTAPLNLRDTDNRIDLYIDKTSIEIFINEGEVVFTELFFPEAPLTSINLESNSAQDLNWIEVFEIN